MQNQNDDKDYFRAIFSITVTVIVVLAVLVILMNSTTNDKTRYLVTSESTVVTCKYDERADLNIIAEDAYRRGNTIRIKDPDEVFMIRDPLHRCEILK